MNSQSRQHVARMLHQFVQRSVSLLTLAALVCKEDLRGDEECEVCLGGVACGQGVGAFAQRGACGHGRHACVCRQGGMHA
eukprot:364821-Chlamydomonas_euryale.AAC.19